MSVLTALSIGAIVIIAYGVGFVPSFHHVDTKAVSYPSGEVIWQKPGDIRPCGNSYGAQALTMNAYPGSPDCLKSWFVATPHLNYTAEAAWYAQHNRDFTEGVIFDDGGQVAKSEIPNFPAPFDCVLLYTPVQPFSSSCIVLTVSLSGGAYPLTGETLYNITSRNEAGWEAIISQSMSNLHASRVMLLCYGLAPSAWRGSMGASLPIPPAYAKACADYAASHGIILVTWR